MAEANSTSRSIGSQIKPLRGCVFRSHGKTESAEYIVWCGMKRRCYNRNCRSFQDYGGRGIKVCDRWIHSFENFLSDMGPRPDDGYELDRFPDNDGDYRPGNCRWVKRKHNLRNKRSNRRIEFNGKRLCISEWAELTGLTWNQIANRLRIGWSIERTLTTPVQPLSERASNFVKR